MLPNVRGCTRICNGTEGVPAQRTRAWASEFKLYCLGSSLQQRTIYVNANILGFIQLRSDNTDGDVLRVQQHFNTRRSVQWTHVEISATTFCWRTPKLHACKSLYQHYKSGVIDDFRCLSCNSCTSATRREHIAQCPEILTVVLWRADGENGNIDKAVDFPLECVCPSTLGVQQEGTVENTLNKLFGIVQHQERMGGGGHYMAVTNKGTTDPWHHYNDRDMKISKFQNRRQNKTYIGFQRSANILFYQCPRPPRRNINDSIMVDTTRRLNNDNGEPTNPSTERTIEHSP